MRRMPTLWPLLMPLGTTLLRIVPLRVASWIAAAAGEVCFHVQRSRRRAVEANLDHIVPAAPATARRRLARATFRNFTAIWVDVLRLPLLPPQHVVTLIEPASRAAFRAHLNGLLAEGRGVLVVSAHLGAVDIGGACLSADGWAVTRVGEDIAPRLFDVWRRYRSSSGLRLLSQRRAAVTAFRALSRGDVVAVVADRAVRGPAAIVDLCGGRWLMPTGPAAYASKAGVPIVVACLVRQRADRRYHIVFRSLPAPGRDPIEITQAIATAFGEVIAHYPDQWFVFQPGWIAPESSGAEVPAGSAPLAYRMP